MPPLFPQIGLLFSVTHIPVLPLAMNNKLTQNIFIIIIKNEKGGEEGKEHIDS